MATRLPKTSHAFRPWRIHDIAPDFRVEDVWELPWHGSAQDFRRFVRMLASGSPAGGSSGAARALFAVREKVGAILGWDEPDERTLRDRLPADLREAPGPDFGAVPFRSLYLVEDEFAAELANRTMHGVMHLGRVPDEGGEFRAEMAVLVKPNGLFGRAYMAAIKPFRYLIVYPALFRQWERAWRRQRPERANAEEAQDAAVPRGDREPRPRCAGSPLYR